MTSFHYSSLLGPRYIRLLRLLPSAEETEQIHCRIVDYSLLQQQPSNAVHLYEALSYVWGNPEDVRPILLHDQNFNVTKNLYGALLKLRNPTFDRILWVDAVCINQQDEKEKESQIQLMPAIYGHANRVIVWLGEEHDGSSEAFKDIRAVTRAGTIPSPPSKENKTRFIKLLQRPWFRRIWVLQEVGMARNILVKCGCAEINGNAFCAGLDALQLKYNISPSLQNLIEGVTHLIRESNSRPGFEEEPFGRLPLGKLVDMYHGHKATKRHDMIYALLGLCSEDLRQDPRGVGLLPDYRIAWEDLFQRLVSFLLHQEVAVETWRDNAIAVIRSKGRILGRVTSVNEIPLRYLGHYVVIEFRNQMGVRGKQVAWFLDASAQPVLPNDLLCQLEGASSPTIIRACKDYFSIIMVAALREGNTVEESHIAEGLPGDFLLVWNWESLPEPSEIQEAGDAAIHIPIPELSITPSERAASLFTLAYALQDVMRCEEAAEVYKRVIDCNVEDPTYPNKYKVAQKENMGLISYGTRKWKEARDILFEVVQEKSKMQGLHHPDTLRSVAKLMSVFWGPSRLDAEQQAMFNDLGNITIGSTLVSADQLVFYFRTLDKDVLELLFEIQGGRLQVTEEVFEVAAADETKGGNLIALLLENRRDVVLITGPLAKAALENESHGKDILRKLLKYKGSIYVMEEAVAEIVLSFDEDLVNLLRQRGVSIAIRGWTIHFIRQRLCEMAPRTSMLSIGEVLSRVMKQLLTLKKKKDHITEEAVAMIAHEMDGQMMSLLLHEHGAEFEITEAVVKAAIWNTADSGRDIISLLLGKIPNDICLTKDMIESAGYIVPEPPVALLLERKSSNFQATDKIIGMALLSTAYGPWVELLSLVLDHLPANFQVTGKVLQATAASRHWDIAVPRLSGLVPTQVYMTGSSLEEAVKWPIDGEVLLDWLLEIKPNDVEITEQMFIAALRSVSNNEEKLRLLLAKMPSHFVFTETILASALKSTSCTERILPLLLAGPPSTFVITEKLLSMAASLTHGIVNILVEKVPKDVLIAETVLAAAAANVTEGYDILALLLERRPNNITERTFVAAAANERYAESMIALLFEQCPNDFHFTEKAAEALAIINRHEKQILKMMMNWNWSDIHITEERIKTVGDGPRPDRWPRILDLLLIHHGDKVHVTDKAVLEIARAFPERTLKLLLRQKPEISISDDLLEAAAANTNEGKQMVEMLLYSRPEKIHITEKAVLTAATHSWYWPDILAVFLSRRECQDFNRQNIAEKAFQNALEKMDMFNASLILDYGVDVSRLGGKHGSALNAAIAAGDEKLASHILQEGADLTSLDDQGATPLNLAAKRGIVNILKRLLDKGANIDVADNAGWTPLNSAACKGNYDIVKLLLKHKANLSAANSKSWTPLYSAARNGHLMVVKLLLDESADVDAADDVGNTPLNSAALHGWLKVVELLSIRGANAATQNSLGSTPLNSVAGSTYEKDVREWPFVGFEPYERPPGYMLAETASLLLRMEEVDSAVPDNNGNTPLHSAASAGNCEVLKRLLYSGADITAANNDGLTPLHSAARKGHRKVVKLLLKKGADTTITSNDGSTPLMLAREGGYVEVVELL